jgi:rhamnose utilization protein RhaD (predicted bifunctional aldolase and dehydrogenase)/NAD(P)-dependent dehydrogenase (short-subunit alcohol dehydrogenase family)
MESRYREDEAQRFLERYGPQHGEDLALRVYTSRLLGQDPALVLHGGGNTSVKSRVTELLGDVTDVLYVKGSGWDLAAIEPRGFPACRLERLRRCCERPTMTDEEMVAELRGQMIDPASPTPSVEALLHAYLPAKFIDHTHADAVLAVVDQPGSADLVRTIYGDDALFVPYVMPGFVLARKVAELFGARSRAGAEPTAMILDKHGIFTWGATARESYERMITAVTLAERHMIDHAPPARRAASAPPVDLHAVVAPIARGALARASGASWIVCWRATPALLDFTARADLATVSAPGCATPDHVIRTKARPLVVPPLDFTQEAALKAHLDGAIEAYAASYHEYFRRSCAARGVTRKELDPWPRVILFPGLGALTAGRTRKDAEIVADIYEHTAQVITAASALRGYEPVGELDLFDVEYWSLEQAKLAKGATRGGDLERKVALITGAASGIGFATARAMLAAGAHVVLTDRRSDGLDAAAVKLEASHPGHVTSWACDVCDGDQMRQAVAQACARFGGLDVVVSNAGAVFTGGLHTSAGDAALRSSLEVNLLGHQNVARAATEAMLRQGTGGVLLFNASKSAWNPGPDFGPYAVAKAALLALMRQYAIDLGPHGIRANAVNADRIRTALFGEGVLEARAKARGLEVDQYFTANLLGRETTADDVARALVHLAAAEATSGCVLTVDGGNAAAFPR